MNYTLDVSAVDPVSQGVTWSFGIATPPKDDNSDILATPEMRQRVLDILDEP